MYNQILGSFHSTPIRIPSGSIDATLTFSESLVSIARDLGCTHLISAQIATALQAHRLDLLVSIKNDPARYLKFALHLENEALYTESLIHLVGAYPCWPWPTKRDTLPDEIMKLVQRKAKELDQLCIEAERELLLLTIQVRDGAVQPQVTSQFDTWFVVQTFRDQLAREFDALERSKSRALRRGTIIRKIKAGGSAYMPYEEMRRLMLTIMPSAEHNLEEDLGLLKEYASDIVADLAKNELMLDVEANGVGYLTCVKVRKEDIPRLAGGLSEG